MSQQPNDFKNKIIIGVITLVITKIIFLSFNPFGNHTSQDVNLVGIGNQIVVNKQ